MCTSISIIIFLVFVASATALLAFATLTPALWTSEKDLSWDEFKDHFKMNFNHFGRCTKHLVERGKINKDGCIPFWTEDDEPTWRKATGCVLAVATVFGLITTVWSIVALIGCCCRGCLTLPLPSTALIALATSVVPPVLVAVYKDESLKVGDFTITVNKKIGYSMIGSIVATGALFIAFFFGLLIVNSRKPEATYHTTKWSKTSRV